MHPCIRTPQVICWSRLPSRRCWRPSIERSSTRGQVISTLCGAGRRRVRLSARSGQWRLDQLPRAGGERIPLLVLDSLALVLDPLLRDRLPVLLATVTVARIFFAAQCIQASMSASSTPTWRPGSCQESSSICGRLQASRGSFECAWRDEFNAGRRAVANGPAASVARACVTVAASCSTCV